jgi:hypothetical protein
MQKPSRGRQEAYCFLGISLLGLGIIPLIAFSGRTGPTISIQQSQLVWLAFAAICVAGAIAGMRPSSYSRAPTSDARAHDGTEETGGIRNNTRVVYREGHHYSCDAYSGHVISIHKRVYCAGCTGLAVGGLTAGVGSLFHLVTDFSSGAGMLLFWFGFTGVAIGLFQHPIYRILRLQNGYVRIAVNVLFVNGAFLLLFGADELTSSISLDVYILMIILLWISARVAMSKTEHTRICNECPELSCSGR